jgi:hypothetical protein
MPAPDAQHRYKPSPEAIALLCDRLQRMGVSMSEAAARSLLESVLAVEGARLDAVTRGTLQASLEAIRRAAEAAMVSLTGAAEAPRRDYELSFPPPAEPAPAAEPVQRLPPSRPIASRGEDRPEPPLDEDEPRPAFKRRRDR